MDDRPPINRQNWSKYYDKRVLYAGAVLVSIVCLFIIVRVLMSRHPEHVGLAIPLLAVPIGIIFLAVYITKYSPRRVRPTAEYDMTRYNLFLSSLDALSIGLGINPPSLVVMGVPFPDSYVIGLGSPAIAVTPSLLVMDLTDQEMEAILATGLAKMVGLHLIPSWPDIYADSEVGSDITGQIPMFTLDQNNFNYCLSVLKADTLAARLTGQPEALQSAIVKLRAVFEQMAPYRRRLRVQFIEIPTTSVFMRPSDKLARELTRLRLENLERIEAGQRPDFSSLRDGKPVVGPKGWE